MNRKKLYAALTASACFISTFAAMPQIMTSTYAAEVTYDSFDTSYNGWHGTEDDNDIVPVENASFNGSRSMSITNRRTPDEGAASSKGLYLFGGIKYNYSVNVFSESDETFHFTLRYIDEKTEKETVVELDSKKVKAGQWTELASSYKAPKGTYEYELKITTDSTNDFSFDDFKITTKKSNMDALAAPAGKGLKDEFGAYFRVGNILNGGTVNNSGITGIILKDHNAIECENETKPDATIVASGSSDTNVKVSLSRCAAICDFAEKNGLGFRGHTLVWHSQTPEWFFKTGFNDSGSYVNSATMDKRMESYIKNMFNAFKTQYPNLDLYAYDVCNEVINDGTAKQGGLRPTNNTNGRDGSSAWVRVYGNNSFVEKAFTYARQYAPPTCKLYYNDYNEFAYDKKNCIKETILKPLAAKGVLDGMGMQSHIDCSASNSWGSTQEYLAAMDDYLSLGIDVQVTELDISRDGGKWSDQQQATKYKAIFQHAMEWNQKHPNGPNVTLVQVWGPNDNNSWVAKNNAGQPNYPLLYDGNNQPKSAYTAITSIVPDSQWTTGKPYTGPGGGTYTPPSYDPDEKGYYFESTFEGSVDGWEGRGAASVSTSGRTAYEGKEALLCQDRTATWNGSAMNLSPAFKPGETYSFSVNAMTFDGGDTTTFKFTMQYTDASGEAVYSEIASATAPKGEWVQLANKEYTIPADATNMLIYVETTDEDSTMNFYIDDAVGAVKGTDVPGAGQPKVVTKTKILGDTDFDGTISAFDMPGARKAVLGKVTDSAVKKNADVDQSGEVNMNDLVLLQEFILGKIKEFPVNKPAVPTIDASVYEGKFSGVNIASSWKKDGENNPLTTQRFGADPGWMVYDGRLYLYTTNDAFEYKNGQLWENSYDSGTINCISSADLVNWTDHGAIPVAGQHKSTTNPTNNGAAKWANRAWAPDACWKMINGKPKFFLYFANSGGGIGVLTADSPTGPWTDPIGKPLLDWNTPGNSGVVWMFDPGVYYDEKTGEAYITFGGGVDNKDKANPKTGRIAKLGDDMISISGSTKTMETPYLFEDSSLIKIGDTWYYSYCTNWNVPGGTNINGTSFGSGEICYMTSKNPMGNGEWTKSSFKGKVLPGTGKVDKGGNNHHSIIYFKDKYYVAYHTRAQALSMGISAKTNNGGTSADGNYRSTHLDPATFNPSTGQITSDVTMKGVSQIEAFNPYEKVQAETMSNQSKGVSVTGLGDTIVKAKKGDWLKVSGASLDGVKSITVKGSGNAVVKFCVGSPKGDVIGYGELNGDECTLAPAMSDISGSKDIYIVFSGDGELDYWSFEK
ncbi:MAG: endo-1,4-beta-xylanase [Ruminococcus sp.]|nr:endo-1,4-beta-xylanase [Ruminococcus sp.]